jgi:cytochrome c oxidase cbb3-type subunit I/II
MANDNQQNQHKEHWHRRWLEHRLGLFTVATTIAISIGGLVEIVPMFTAKAGPPPLEGVAPFTPLEIAGRDIYIREGCYTCHSQMIRPMRAEILRYGEWSRAGEYAYEHPFQLGSRRIGPDLHRVGGKYPDAWHYEHMRDPRSTSPGSTMPAYPWLLRWTINERDVRASVRALRRAGVPYTEEDIANVAEQIEQQGEEIVGRLADMGIHTEANREIIAVIAYLQRLGVEGTAAIEGQKEAAAAADAVAATGASAEGGS